MIHHESREAMTCLPEQRLEGHVCGNGASMAERVAASAPFNIQYLGEPRQRDFDFGGLRFGPASRRRVLTCVQFDVSFSTTHMHIHMAIYMSVPC